MRKALTMLALLGLVLGGCGEEKEHEHGGGGTVDVPQHYGDAVEKCEQLSKKIGELIASGHLDDVHAAAADIKKIAEKLPGIAQEDLPPSMLRDVNLKAKELAGMFSAIDKAADAGNKEETVKLHNRMKELVAGLLKHVAHAKKEDGHEEDGHKEDGHDD